MQRPPIPRMAVLLGFGCLLPFAALAMAMWAAAPIHLPAIALAQIAYGATILSFLGAVQWGAEVYGLGLLILGMLACYGMDQKAVAAGFLPLWYTSLRQPLTLLVCLLLALTWVRLALTF